MHSSAGIACMSEPEYRFNSAERPIVPGGPCARSNAPRQRVTHSLLIAFISSGIGGCAVHSAPSFVLFGAYFPAWMLVATIGIFAAAAARIAMVATGLAAAIPFQLLICTAIGITTAIVLWLIWFAR